MVGQRGRVFTSDAERGDDRAIVAGELQALGARSATVGQRGRTVVRTQEALQTHVVEDYVRGPEVVGELTETSGEPRWDARHVGDVQGQPNACLDQLLASVTPTGRNDAFPRGLFFMSPGPNLPLLLVDLVIALVAGVAAAAAAVVLGDSGVDEDGVVLVGVAAPLVIVVRQAATFVITAEEAVGRPADTLGRAVGSRLGVSGCLAAGYTDGHRGVGVGWPL